MTEAGEQENQYTDGLVAALEWMWGEGFLSPGGADEVAALLQGVDLAGTEVLDVGCGLGGVDVLLATEHGAARVVGIDVEAPLIERARERAERAGLSGRIRFEQVVPGPFPFDAESFDVVFTKDAMIHIPDKLALYREVLRVLRPGGLFVGSDWLRGGEGAYSAAMRAWFDVVHLQFEMKNLAQTRSALEGAGFVEVELRDRNEWYRAQVRAELAAVSGENYARLAARVGEEAAAHRLESSTLKRDVVERGELRPTHLRARKPR